MLDPNTYSQFRQVLFDLCIVRMMIKLIKKYRNALLTFLGVEALIASLVIYGLTYGHGFDISPLIPLTNGFHEIMFVAIILPISSSIGAVIGGYALAPIFLHSHKTIFRKAIYGIQETSPAKLFKRTFQGYYPGLLAFNISSIILFLTPKIQNQLLTPTVLEVAPLVMQYI